MSAAAQLKNLKQQINQQVSEFEARRQHNRKWARVLFISRIGLAFLVTVFSGVAVAEGATWPRNMALCSSALLTFVALCEGWYRFAELYVLHTRTSSQLTALTSKISFLESGKPSTQMTASEAEALFNEFQNILNSTDEAWVLSTRASLKSARPSG